MPSLQDSLRQLFSALDDFLHLTLGNENLSKVAEKERSKIVAILAKLYSDHDALCPNAKKKTSVAKSQERQRDDSISSAGSSVSFPESDSSNRHSCSPNEIAPTTVKALTNPTKIGFLQTRTSGSKQKPYCVLHKNIMYWFAKPSDRQQEGAIFVSEYEFKPDEKKIAKKNFTFDLVGLGRKPYQFVADNKEDLNSWKTAFDAARTFKEDDDGLTYFMENIEDKTNALAQRQLPKPPPGTEQEYQTYTEAVSEGSQSHIYSNDHALVGNNNDDVDDNVYEILDNVAFNSKKSAPHLKK